ncbi:MAG: hypothetical protein J1E37_06755, partial [Prevotella sp.]|nr:hypothetical protein [Prevotella sp.]
RDHEVLVLHIRPEREEDKNAQHHYWGSARIQCVHLHRKSGSWYHIYDAKGNKLKTLSVSG